MKDLKIIFNESDNLFLFLTDCLFWTLLILYSNPGGIFQALDLWYLIGGLKANDFLFLIMSICYAIIPKTFNINDIDFAGLRKYLLIFLFYYFIAFVYFIPIFNNSSDYSLIASLIKSRWVIFSIFLYLYIYEFYKRSWDIFLKIFLYSSIIITFLFLQAIITNIEILPTIFKHRNFIDVNRILMESYGFMFLLIPLGIVFIVFKIKSTSKYVVYLGFILVSLTYLISLERRYIFGALIIFILAAIVNAYIKNEFLVLVKQSLKVIFVTIFIIISSYFVVPRYVEAGGVAIIETVNVMIYGTTTTGDKDVRLTLNRPFINQQFYEHPFFGTGFDNRWRILEGDDQGYEARDYPFLAALAMFGLVGVAVFLPVYILLIKFIIDDIKYLKYNDIIDKNSIYALFLTFIVYFIYDFLLYFNYFSPVSNAGGYFWYSILSLYLASRYIFYTSQKPDLEISL